MTKTDRWLFAIHESGHAVAAIALNGRCDGAVVFEDGDGGAAQLDELDNTRYVYATAAGPAAESLAERYPIPEAAIISREFTADELETIPVFQSAPGLACAMVRTASTRKHSDSDARTVALWAITGRENDPECWARRVSIARGIAEKIVQHNSAAIIRIATELFVRGSLGRDQITALFQGE